MKRHFDTVHIWTDGACSGNPGPGGWGVLLRYKDHERELCGGESRTTNNQMELLACIKALEALKDTKPVRLYTDSSYVKNGITSWVTNWKTNHWRTAGKKPVKNQTLWQRLDALNNHFDVDWQWVKGHAGNDENERADVLARQGMARHLRETGQS